jgi:hypothetical protein
MLTLQEITEFRITLDSARHEVVGRTKAFNLVALYQALDREEALARMPPTPTSPPKQSKGK